MNIEFPFQKFVNLVAFDQTTNALERDVIRLEKEINEFQNEVFRIEDQLALDTKQVSSCKKKVDEKELEMKDFDAKIKIKQDHFDRIVNQREIQSAYQEIELLKKKQYEHEEGLLEAWNILESTNRAYLETKATLQKRAQDLEDLITSSVAHKKDLQKKIIDRHAERSQLEAGIPEEWLEKYAVMRRTVSNPVVLVINNSCSACFYSITQQDSARLKRHALLQCKECYRFLYME